MHYILIQVDGVGQLYQEVAHGIVQRLTDMDGNTVNPPSGTASWVVNANPTQPTWALATPDVANPPASRVVTKLEYLRLFTQEERVAIRTAAKANAVLEDYMELLALAEIVDLSDADTVAGVNALEMAGLIAPGRAQEILGA